MPFEPSFLQFFFDTGFLSLLHNGLLSRLFDKPFDLAGAAPLAQAAAIVNVLLPQSYPDNNSIIFQNGAIKGQLASHDKVDLSAALVLY